ncbi:hypothetical protein PC128_g8238 [Phytophthora cactorum]|nr:hypothetical protein PC120_g17492 [Phytophthora cactorum]KAG3195738.1 hypothetical protein PC128_g8238 [Phytophthora cactorum]KAG4040817.1 hypothetical protein PC123_g23650 [Phytophthora cactorum]
MSLLAAAATADSPVVAPRSTVAAPPQLQLAPSLWWFFAESAEAATVSAEYGTS